MNIALCAIGRRENQYAIEFIEHYIKLGVSKFYIYDNNYGDEEHFEDVLQYYIDNDIVEITDFRNRQCCQLDAYNDCYSKHADSHDWIAFFDFDEFLVFVNHHNMDEFLEDKQEYEAVLVNWMVMTDNDLVYNDSRPMMERFTKPMEMHRIIEPRQGEENSFVKSIVRGHLKNAIFTNTPHVPMTLSHVCNADGKKVDVSSNTAITYDNAYIKHFTTKTIEEYMTRKMQVGVPDRTYRLFLFGRNRRNIHSQKFFKINRETPEKKTYLEMLK